MDRRCENCNEIVSFMNSCPCYLTKISAKDLINSDQSFSADELSKRLTKALEAVLLNDKLKGEIKEHKETINDLVSSLEIEKRRHFTANTAAVENMETLKKARKALTLATIRLEILTARMRGCHEETKNHELLDEAEMFCKEAKEALKELEG